MWARRRLRVVLDGKNRVLPVLYSFDRSVVEVKVGDLKRLRARNATGLSPHRESMILGRDKYLSRSKIAHRMIAPPVAVGQLDRLASHRQAEQLMAETDAKDRQCPVRQRPNGIDRVTDRCGVAGPVRQEDAVRLQGASLRRSRRRRDDRDAAAVPPAPPQAVARAPEVVRVAMIC